MKHRAFAIAIQDLTGQRTFLRFGPNTTVNDIYDVIDEEVEASKGAKILGFSLLSAVSEKKLMKVYAEWKDHFNK